MTMSKYSVTYAPPLPAKCAGCGADALGHNRFIDLTLSLDFYGAVLLCESCAKEMVGLIDFCPVAERDDALHDLQSAQEKIEELVEEIGTLNGVISSFNYLANRPEPEPVSSASLFD